MISRFDEVILQKASKLELASLEAQKIDKSEMAAVEESVDEKLKMVYAE